jgi:hypothetical protein
MKFCNQIRTSEIIFLFTFLFCVSMRAMFEPPIPSLVMIYGISLFNSSDINRFAQISKGWNKLVHETADYRKDFMVRGIKNSMQIEINEKQISWNKYANVGAFVNDTYYFDSHFPTLFQIYLSGLSDDPICYYPEMTGCERFELKKYFEVTTPDKTRLAQIYQFCANQPLPHCRAASFGWLIYFQPYFNNRGVSCVHSFKKLNQGNDNYSLSLSKVDKIDSYSASTYPMPQMGWESFISEMNNLLKRIEVLKNNSNKKRMVICDKEVSNILARITFNK